MKSKNFRYLIILLPLLGSIGCDQTTKQMASSHLKFEAEESSYFFDLFQLIYAENTGAFLSLGNDLPPILHTLFLIVMPLAVLAGLFFYTLFGKQHTALQLAGFSLVLGGGFSNIFDRMVNGYVVDFMLLGWDGLKTGIFNFADVFIMLGIGLLLWGELRGAGGQKNFEKVAPSE